MNVVRIQTYVRTLQLGQPGAGYRVRIRRLGSKRSTAPSHAFVLVPERSGFPKVVFGTLAAKARTAGLCGLGAVNAWHEKTTGYETPLDCREYDPMIAGLRSFLATDDVTVIDPSSIDDFATQRLRDQDRLRPTLTAISLVLAFVLAAAFVARCV